MKQFEIAHIKEQGVDIIIVPLHPTFASLDQVEKTRLLRVLQQGAKTSGLLGTVVPIWEVGVRGMAFLAPPPMHPFFLSIDLVFVEANINRQLNIQDAPSHLLPARRLETAA